MEDRMRRPHISVLEEQENGESVSKFSRINEHNESSHLSFTITFNK